MAKISTIGTYHCNRCFTVETGYSLLQNGKVICKKCGSEMSCYDCKPVDMSMIQFKGSGYYCKDI